MNDTSIRRPAMPLYVSDFVDSESVALMPLEAVGVYIKLLCYNWKNGSIPVELEQLATLLRLNVRTLRRIWPHVAPKFRLKSASDHFRLTNERVEKELKRADEKSEKSRNAAQSRHTDHADAPTSAVPRAGAVSVSSSVSVPKETDTPASPGDSATPQLSLVSAPRYVPDLASAYARYPRKEGRKRGFALLTKQLTTPDRFAAFERAIANYVAQVAAAGTETRYVKHFATFAGCWEDYIDARAAAPPSRAPTTSASTREQRAYSRPASEVLAPLVSADPAPPPPEFQEFKNQLGRRVAAHAAGGET